MNEIVKLAVDTAKGSVTNYSAQDANEVLRKAFLDIAGTEKIDHKTFRRNQVELFEVIEEALDVLVADGLTNQFDQFVEIRNLAWGDSNVFTVEDNKLFDVAVVADGLNNLRRQRIDNGSLTVTTKTYGVKIYEELHRFLAGRINWVNMVNRIAKSYNNQIATDIYNAVYNSYDVLGATYGITGSWSESTLSTLVGHVEAATNQPVEIYGTKTALAKVVPSIVSDVQKGARNDLGYYGKINGVDVREIKQVHKPGTDTFAINDSFLLIIPSGGEKMVKMVIEGDALITENQNTNGDMSMEYSFIKKAGCNVLKTKQYGVYRLA